MKRKINLGFLLGLGLVALTACNGNSANTNTQASTGAESSQASTSSSASSQTNKLNVTVKDEIFTNTNETLSYVGNNAKACLESLGFELVLKDGKYQIADTEYTYKDKNYTLNIYNSNNQKLTSVDDIVINGETSITVKYEESNTLDSVDKLVDKALYGYIKDVLTPALKLNTVTYTANHWEFMLINLLKNAGYDSDLTTISYHSDFLASLNNVAFDTFDDVYDEYGSTYEANFGKYYYACKAIGEAIPSAYKVAYQEYLNNLPTDYAFYGEYKYPFSLSPAKALNMTSANLTSVLSTTYKADASAGYDGLAWEEAALGLYNEEKINLADFPIAVQYDYDWNTYQPTTTKNGTSTALLLLPFTAKGVNPRGSQYENQDGKDLVELLFKNFYDSNLNLIKVYEADTTTNFSTAQIYAALASYKALRDSGTKQNIFA